MSTEVLKLVKGKLTITTGLGQDTVQLFRTAVGKTLTINTSSGNDTVSIDDSLINGIASLSLGAGEDQFLADTKSTNSAGNLLTAKVTFASHLTVTGGTEDDRVDFSK